MSKISGGGAMDKALPTRTVELDFSPLLENGKRFAVHCETKEDALHFLACLRKKYPEKCSGWEVGETHFGRYSTTCYSPCLNMGELYTLKFCSKGFYVDEGYTIIPYVDLIVVPEIEESEQSLDFLLN